MAIDIARTTVRSLLAATFIADGVDAIFNADKHAEIFQRFAPVLEKAGAPPVLTADARTLSRLAGGATITAGLCLSVGKHPRLSALTLAGMSVGIAVVNNPIWAETDKEERQSSALDLIRRLAITGGLLAVAMDRGGKPSSAWKRQNRKEQRAEIRALQQALAGSD